MSKKLNNEILEVGKYTTLNLGYCNASGIIQKVTESKILLKTNNGKILSIDKSSVKMNNNNTTRSLSYNKNDKSVFNNNVPGQNGFSNNKVFDDICPWQNSIPNQIKSAIDSAVNSGDDFFIDVWNNIERCSGILSPRLNISYSKSCMRNKDFIDGFLCNWGVNNQLFLDRFAVRHFISKEAPCDYIYLYLLNRSFEKSDFLLMTNINYGVLNNEKRAAYQSFLLAACFAIGVKPFKGTYLDNDRLSINGMLKYLRTYAEDNFQESEINDSLLRNLPTWARYNPDLAVIETKTSDLFEQARSADLRDKDTNKAIDLYKKAISSEVKLSASVPNLAMLYSRVEMFEEAIKLLELYGQLMDEQKLCNLKCNIYFKCLDPKYKEDHLKCLDYLIDNQINLEKKLFILRNKAISLYRYSDFDKSISCYKRLESLAESDLHTGRTRDNYMFSSLYGLALNYQKKGDQAKMANYAKRAYEYNPKSVGIQRLLNSQTTGYEAIELQKNDDFDFDYLDSLDVNKFLDDKIQEIHLQDYFKKNDLFEDDLYSGTEEELKKFLDKNSLLQAPNELSRAEGCLAYAKLIHQIRDRDSFDSSYFSEQKYLAYISDASRYFGDSFLFSNSLNANYDDARYLYTQTIKTIYPIGKSYNNRQKSNWIIAILRYVQTLFDDVDIIEQSRGDLDKIVSVELRHNTWPETFVKKRLKQQFRKNFISDQSIFVVNLIVLLTMTNNFIKGSVLNYLYDADYLGNVVVVLTSLINANDSGFSFNNSSLSQDLFSKLWDDATRSYINLRDDFLIRIRKLLDNPFNLSGESPEYVAVKNHKFNQFHLMSDRQFSVSLIHIIDNLIQYKASNQISDKTEILEQADKSSRQLIKDIRTNPTFISYEYYINFLETLVVKVQNESEQLFSGSAPKIELSISDEVSIDKTNSQIMVSLRCFNELNCLDAEDVRLDILCDNAKLVDAIEGFGYVTSGKQNEALLKFQVSCINDLPEEISFKTIVYYSYKKNLAENINSSYEKFFTCSLLKKDSFVPIENKFKTISRGAIVKDSTMFYGRNEDIRGICGWIQGIDVSDRAGKCLALFGQTRTGKSSLLYHLRKELNSDPLNIVPEPLSLGTIMINSRENWLNPFLFEIANGIIYEISNNYPYLMSYYNKIPCSFSVEDLLENENALNIFNLFIKNIYKAINDCPKDYKIILLIDEFTYVYDGIRKGTLPEDFMKFWKAFNENNDIISIIVGQDYFMQFVNDFRFTNDFGSIEIRHVSYLSEEHAKQMMSEPIPIKKDDGSVEGRYEESALTRIYELTSGSAYLIAKFCDWLVEYLNKKQVNKITKAIVDDCLHVNLPGVDESLFESQFHDKSTLDKEKELQICNKDILKKIANSSRNTRYADLSQIVENVENGLNVLEQLERRDVVEIERGKRVKIKVELYKEWLNERSGLGGY